MSAANRGAPQTAMQATKLPPGRPGGEGGANAEVDCGSSSSPLSDDAPTLRRTDKMRQLWTWGATPLFSQMRQPSREP